ncbi:MAG: hypothetical protein LBD92_02265 [Oscillospiraceae bacterium]|jgi:X-X-X-Leu-X-X-Gly heptad repeat protein|nr:hypothetical protein [Oscillospiraceae bacterium]
MRQTVRLTAAALLAASLVLTASCSGQGSGGESAVGEEIAPPDGTRAVVGGKDEIVYALLAADGAPRGEYVVNILDVTRAGYLTDYGDYDEVKNLSGARQLENVPGEYVTLSAEAGRVYYQGSAGSAPLPWSFAITYGVNGSPVSPEELAGASGRIRVDIAARPEGDNYFNANYLLQITVKLDTSRCTGISAPDATQAGAGRDRVLSYTVMPGAGADIRIECDASGFAMDGIEISALPFSMESAMPDISGLSSDLERFTDAIAELSGGVAALDDGARALKSGAGELASGAVSFADGISALSGSSNALTEGSTQINGALEAIAGGLTAQELPDFSQLAQLTSTLRQTAGALIEARDGLTELGGGFEQAFAAIDGAIDAIPGDEITRREFDELYAAAPSQKSVIDSLAEYYAAASAAKAAYASALPALEGVAPAAYAAAERLNTAAATLTIVAAQAGAATDADIGGQIAQLTEAMTALSGQYAEFHSGLTAYTGGVGELARAGRELAGGTRELADGVSGVADGVSALRGGADTLSEAAAQIPGKIDEMLGGSQGDTASGAKPVSFASEKNENITLVQFVMRTEKIAAPEEPPAPTAATEPEREDKSFKARFLDLFKS